VTDFRDRALLVIGHALDKHRDPAGAVTFIGDFFVGHTGKLAGTTLNGTFDVLARHVCGLRRRDRRAKPGVRFLVTTAVPRRDLNFLDEGGKNLSPLRVERAFLSPNGCPLGMSGHRDSSLL
jgi:hypothetical protein